jgi:hypothetical protein
MKRGFLSLICALIVVSGCGIRLGKMNHAQKAELLARQREKLPYIRDPVSKTKTYITISRILLDFAAGAAQNGDTAAMDSFLVQYVNAISAASQTMAHSGRDALRRSAGYRDLELTLRSHGRRLSDIADILHFDERAPVEEALAAAHSARQEMLRRLFP